MADPLWLQMRGYWPQRFGEDLYVHSRTSALRLSQATSPMPGCCTGRALALEQLIASKWLLQIEPGSPK